MRRSLLALALLTPMLLAAQGGATSTWSLHGTLPDTVQKASRGMLSTIDIRATMATDGHRFSMVIEPGPGMLASSLSMDLSTVQLKVLSSTLNDSIHIGVVLPPEIAAQMGGGIGLQMSLSLPDSLLKRMIPDSLETRMTEQAKNVEQPEFRDSGRSDTVAGLACRIWTVTPREATDSNTVEFCLAPKTVALTAVQEAMKSRFAAFTSNLEKLASSSSSKGWPSGLVPIRFRLLGDGDLTFELVSVVEGVPAAAVFQLPEGLTPFDPAILQGMMGGMQDSTEG